MPKITLLYFAAVAVSSAAALLCYGADKQRAKQRQRRYRERTLLMLGVLLGAAGALLGMSLFHHKTRKIRFWIVNWISLIAQIAAGCFLLRHD